MGQVCVGLPGTSWQLSQLLTASASSSSDGEGAEELCKTLSMCNMEVIWKPYLQGGVAAARRALQPHLEVPAPKTSVATSSWKEGGLRFPVCFVVRPPCFPFSFSAVSSLSSCCCFPIAVVAPSPR